MAIHERRIIRFDESEMNACFENEVISVRNDSKPRADKQRHAGILHPSSIRPIPESNTIRLIYADASYREISGSELAVVVMRWCSKRGVPLPKSAIKRLQVTETGLTISISSQAA